jgi:hypothetical protein
MKNERVIFEKPQSSIVNLIIFDLKKFMEFSIFSVFVFLSIILIDDYIEPYYQNNFSFSWVVRFFINNSVGEFYFYMVFVFVPFMFLPAPIKVEKIFSALANSLSGVIFGASLSFSIISYTSNDYAIFFPFFLMNCILSLSFSLGVFASITLLRLLRSAVWPNQKLRS